MLRYGDSEPTEIVGGPKQGQERLVRYFRILIEWEAARGDAEREEARAETQMKTSQTAVMYARVSSKDQEREGFSIPAQQKLLRAVRP